MSSPAGKKNIHGYVTAPPVVEAISVPSDTSGDCTPKPK